MGAMLDHATGGGTKLFVSKEAKKLRPDVDWSKMNHDNQKAKSGLNDPDRSIFHYEHMLPRTQMTDEILAVDGYDKDAVNAIFERAAMAWITKAEDKNLTKLGYRSNRPDPFKIYRQAGIHLVKIS